MHAFGALAILLSTETDNSLRTTVNVAAVEEEARHRKSVRLGERGYSGPRRYIKYSSTVLRYPRP